MLDDFNDSLDSFRTSVVISFYASVCFFFI